MCIYALQLEACRAQSLFFTAFKDEQPAADHEEEDVDEPEGNDILIQGWYANWLAVKELKLSYHSYYTSETILFTIYPEYGNLIQVP